VQEKLTAWMIENKTSEWWRGVLKVQHAINSSWSRSIQRTPIKATFGIHPRSWTAAMNDAELHSMLADAQNDLNEFEFTAPEGYEHVAVVSEPVQVTAQLVHEECSVCDEPLDILPLACGSCGTRCHAE